ncbi:phosphodiester glycosidase family protein [Chryseobacterium sp. Y16C]|uniref:phosphodiester glycosidase family protein n=1 Tax=Chryseobacterium sp. Y16C TaxID=2920939 RepID=UPI001F0AAEFC|nr:phosphodiester glycosidase family protein [Chryseobacterium sp. Y16C]UMQ40135.1 phosphodiester glycosidase family protein [Chryseobacterium sp. Y16C]
MRISLMILCFYSMLCCNGKLKNEDDFVIFKVNPKLENVSLYWKDDDGTILKSIKNLKNKVEQDNKRLMFAMNGGMFEMNNSPKGLYIENFKILNKLDTLSGKGNFYLNPNGVFYLTKNNDAELIETKAFKYHSNIKYATQSGPMLLFNGEINPIFQENSQNVNVRNGVGILKDGNIVFIMSKKEVNFYNFASIFKELGCIKALYLDGFVSRIYYPDKKWIQKDGDFGVMIGVTELKK